MTGSVDVVLYDEEVAGETHCLHDVQFELHSFCYHFGQRAAIYLFGSFIGQVCQIVGFQLQTVKSVYASQLLYLVFRILGRHDFIAVLVVGKLVKQLLVCKLFPVSVFCTELFGDGEVGHDGRVVNAVELHLVQNLAGVAQGFGQIAEDLVHLGACLEPFLFGVEHTVHVIHISVGTQAQQTVVCFGILFVHKVRVVAADNLDVQLSCHFQQTPVNVHLQGVDIPVGPYGRILHLVPLEFYIVVVAPYFLEPCCRLHGAFHVPGLYFLGHFTADTCRADDQSLMKAFQVFVVCSRTHVETVNVCS